MCREVKPVNSENTLPNGREMIVSLLHEVELFMGCPIVSSYSPKAWLPSLLTITMRVAGEAGVPV